LFSLRRISLIYLSRLLLTHNELHPDVIQARGEVEEARKKIGIEINRAIQSLERDAESLKGEEEKLYILINEGLSEKIVAYDALKRDIEVKRSLYNTFAEQIEDLDISKKIESVFFEAPFLLRFKSVPYRDKRAFIITGMKYSYDVASNSKTRQASSLVKISPHDFQVEFGAGVQFFFPYFIFSPEIKISQGLGNTLIYNNDLNEARVLEKITSRVFTISFHFEG